MGRAPTASRDLCAIDDAAYRLFFGLRSFSSSRRPRHFRGGPDSAAAINQRTWAARMDGRARRSRVERINVAAASRARNPVFTFECRTGLPPPHTRMHIT